MAKIEKKKILANQQSEQQWGGLMASAQSQMMSNAMQNEKKPISTQNAMQ
jgi:hypothetical protein